MTSSCSASGARAERCLCLWTVHRCAGASGHNAASARSSPASPSVMRKHRRRRSVPEGAGRKRPEGRVQSAPDQAVQRGAPSRLALAAHVPDSQERLLPVTPHPEHDQQGDVGGLPVQAHADNRAIHDQAHDIVASQVALVPGIPIGPHLPPGAADPAKLHSDLRDVLADRTHKQGRPHPSSCCPVPWRGSSNKPETTPPPARHHPPRPAPPSCTTPSAAPAASSPWRCGPIVPGQWSRCRRPAPHPLACGPADVGRHRGSARGATNAGGHAVSRPLRHRDWAVRRAGDGGA